MKHFNIRVYGVVVNSQNEILINREVIGGKKVIKFPGGGLEWGEGLEDAVRREFQEEFGTEVDVLEVYYVTPYFQQSFFKEEDQIISIYFKVNMPINMTYGGEVASGKIVPTWRRIASLNPEEFYFPIDRHVVKKLLESGKGSTQP